MLWLLFLGYSFVFMFDLFFFLHRLPFFRMIYGKKISVPWVPNFCTRWSSLKRSILSIKPSKWSVKMWSFCISLRWIHRQALNRLLSSYRSKDVYTLQRNKSFFHVSTAPPQLPGKLNELDNNGDLALDLALCRKLEGIATTLVNNKADVDMVDQSGWSLLHKAIQRG